MKLTAVAGHLENGVFYPDQPLPAQNGPAVLTFAVSAPTQPRAGQRPRFSFDEALAMPTNATGNITDLLAAEREESY